MSRHSEHLYKAPGVSRNEGEKPRCDGLRWGEVPLKALYPWGPNRENPPIGTEQYRCKLNAQYHYEALGEYDEWDYPATTGNYCYQHLLSQLFNHHKDTLRFEAWLKDNPVPKE